jgi:hypothetical protein
MSQAVAGVAGGLIAAASPLLNLLFQTKRKIGPYVPDCAVSEEHEDTLTLTRHPVQRGASIVDHAYKEPCELKLQWAWSNSAPQNTLSGFGVLSQLTGFGGSEDYVQQVYTNLLNMQVSGEPLIVSTGKRLYDNMMITSLSLRTDNSSEYSLPMEITLTEVIIVDTQAASLPPQDDQAVPQQTASVTSQGQQQATPATPSVSALSTLTGQGTTG